MAKKRYNNYEIEQLLKNLEELSNLTVKHLYSKSKNKYFLTQEEYEKNIGIFHVRNRTKNNLKQFLENSKEDVSSIA